MKTARDHSLKRGSRPTPTRALSRAVALAASLAGCGKDLPPPPDTTDPSADDTGADTGADTTGDDTGGETGSRDAGDGSGDDTGGDTAEPESCGLATFTDSDGAETDLTAAFTAGDPIALSDDGALTFCAGTWFVRLTIEATVSISGLGTRPAATVLSGGEAGTVILARGAGAAVTVENLTLDRGAALGVGNERAGGGVRCEDAASVTVRGAIFSNHRAYDGAGLAATPGCSVTIEDTTFSDNHSEDDGGAVRLDGVTAALREVRFERNVARDCGALFLNESEVLIEGAYFANNTSTDTQGGAILHYFGTLTVRDAVFEDNDANGYGGALSLLGATALERVTFTRNQTTEGGAIYTYTAYGELSCEDCSFSGNSPDDVATDLGGSYSFGAGADFTCDTSGCSEGG